MSAVIGKLVGSTRAKLITASVVVIIAGFALWFWKGRAKAAEFITDTVSRGSIRNVVNATGTVQAVLTVQVGSQVSGQVESLYADFNSQVKRGQILAKLDPRNYQAAMDGAQANLQSAQAKQSSSEADLNSQTASQKSAQANVDSARVARDNSANIFKRQDELFKQGILSQNDYDTAKSNADMAEAKYNQAVAQAQQVEAQIKSAQAAVNQAKAQVSQAQAALKQAQVNLDYTTISSPVDGVVVSRSVDVGQTVAASLSAPILFVIANDLTKMQVNASVDEADIGNIADVEDVQFTVDAYPNRTFTGRISEIRLEPTTVQNVTTYSVIISVDNSRLELKPGMTANISITVARQDNVLRIANAAMRYLPPGVTRDDVNAMLEKAPPASSSEQPAVSRNGGPSAGAITGASAGGGSAAEPLANAAPTRSDQGQGQAQGQAQSQSQGQGRSGSRRGGGDAAQGSPQQPPQQPSQQGSADSGGWQGGRGGASRDFAGRRGTGDDTGGWQGRQGGGQGGFRRQQESANGSPTTQNQPGALAPGQLWNPAEKIQFPRRVQRTSRPAIVWVMGANKKPEPRQVIVGITDGKSTQVLSGELKEGDQVIVSDSSQAAAAGQQNRQQGGFGGGGGGGFGGGRGGFFGR